MPFDKTKKRDLRIFLTKFNLENDEKIKKKLIEIGSDVTRIDFRIILRILEKDKTFKKKSAARKIL